MFCSECVSRIVSLRYQGYLHSSFICWVIHLQVKRGLGGGREGVVEKRIWEGGEGDRGRWRGVGRGGVGDLGEVERGIWGGGEEIEEGGEGDRERGVEGRGLKQIFPCIVRLIHSPIISYITVTRIVMFQHRRVILKRHDVTYLMMRCIMPVLT